MSPSLSSSPQWQLPLAWPAPIPHLDHLVANDLIVSHLNMCLAQTPRSPLPTYLWGPPGSGKTHILEAVRQVLADRPHEKVQILNPNVLLLDQQDIDDGGVEVVENKGVFTNPTATVFILDDVDQYDEHHQRAAFQYFITAQTNQAWVLAAGHMPPAQLAVREDLRSRLAWGHVFGLNLPTETQCGEVLQRAAKERGLQLSEDLLRFMLSRFSRQLSDLLFLLEDLDAYALQTQRPLTVPLLKERLAML
jgi:DnaA family protein